MTSALLHGLGKPILPYPVGLACVCECVCVCVCVKEELQDYRKSKFIQLLHSLTPS